MNKNLKFKLLAGDFQKGQVALLMSFFIMTIILLVALTVANLMAAEIQMSRGVANSVPAYFAADAGIERCLYEMYKPTGTYCANNSTDYSYPLDNTASASVSRKNNNVGADGVFAGTHRKVNLSW